MFGCSCGHIVQDRQEAEELNTVQQKACVQQHSLESERVAFVHASNSTSPSSSGLHYNITYYTVLYYTILYYTILYYTILYYTVLYYTTLYCTML